jgi:hypothetical protein
MGKYFVSLAADSCLILAASPPPPTDPWPEISLKTDTGDLLGYIVYSRENPLSPPPHPSSTEGRFGDYFAV